MNTFHVHEELAEIKHKTDLNQVIFLALEDKNLFKKLVECLFHNNQNIADKAAWAVSDCALQKSHIIEPYLPIVIEKLLKANTNMQKRCLTRIFQTQQVPKAQQALVFNHCITWVQNNNEQVAIRAFAMKVCLEIGKIHKDLLEELKHSIHLILPFSSKGLFNRGKKILKEIELYQG
ncbi:MAG: Uncharacterised protein [Bacteroidetes bacterium MED-G17]|nr:MAG: Uncharacterised protein [Bacteroidetes bacterium MED-G17]